jgi:hypothetical protein
MLFMYYCVLLYVRAALGNVLLQEETGLSLLQGRCSYRGVTNDIDVGGSGKHYITIFMQVTETL